MRRESVQNNSYPSDGIPLHVLGTNRKTHSLEFSQKISEADCDPALEAEVNSASHMTTIPQNTGNEQEEKSSVSKLGHKNGKVSQTEEAPVHQFQFQQSPLPGMDRRPKYEMMNDSTHIQERSDIDAHRVSDQGIDQAETSDPDSGLSGRFASCPDFTSLDALFLTSCIDNLASSELVTKLNLDSSELSESANTTLGTNMDQSIDTGTTANTSTNPDGNRETDMREVDWNETFLCKSADKTAEGFGAVNRASNALVHRHSSHNPLTDSTDHFRKHNQSLQMYLNDAKAKQRQRQLVHRNSVDSIRSFQGRSKTYNPNQMSNTPNRLSASRSSTMALDSLDERTLPVRSASMQAHHINTHTNSGAQKGAVYPIQSTSSPKRDPQLPSRRHRRGGNELLRPFTCRFKGCTNRYQAWRSLQYHMSSKHLIKTKLVRNRIAVLDANGADLSRFDLDVNYDFTDRDGVLLHRSGSEGGGNNSSAEVSSGGQINKPSQTHSETDSDLWDEARKMLQAATNPDTVKEGGVSNHRECDSKPHPSKEGRYGSKENPDMYDDPRLRAHSQPQGGLGLNRVRSRTQEQSQSAPTSAGLARGVTTESMNTSDHEEVRRSHSGDVNANSATLSSGEQVRGLAGDASLPSGWSAPMQGQTQTQSQGQLPSHAQGLGQRGREWIRSAQNVSSMGSLSGGKARGHSRRHSTNGVLIDSDVPSQLMNVQSYGGSHTHQLSRSQAIQHKYKTGLLEHTFHRQMGSATNTGADGLLEAVLNTNLGVGMNAEAGRNVDTNVNAQGTASKGFGLSGNGDDLERYYAKLFGSSVSGLGLDQMQMNASDSALAEQKSRLDILQAHSMGSINEAGAYNTGQSMDEDGLGMVNLRSNASQRPVSMLASMQEDLTENTLMRRWSGGQPMLSNMGALTSDATGIASPFWFQSMQNQPNSISDQSLANSNMNTPQHLRNPNATWTGGGSGGVHRTASGGVKGSDRDEHNVQMQLNRLALSNASNLGDTAPYSAIVGNGGGSGQGLRVGANSAALQHSTPVFKFPANYTLQNSGNMMDTYEMPTSGVVGSGSMSGESASRNAAWISGDLTPSNALYTTMEVVSKEEPDCNT